MAYLNNGTFILRQYLRSDCLLKLKSLIINLLIPLSVGSLAGFLTMDSMEVYKNLNQPSFAPPSLLFSIVWTALYILMGISSYMVYESNSARKSKALKVYALQLMLNFIWPLIFFNAQLYLFSFIWLIFIWCLVLWMIILFCKINQLSGYLQIPYLLWLTFAAYLNIGVYFLNK